MLFGITSPVEAFGFAHIVRFLPLYLRVLGTPGAEVPTWTGILSAAAYLVGLPLIPFWGVWADKYSRKVVIARSAFVEAVVFSAFALSQNRFQLLVPATLIGFQLGNTGVMLSSLRAVAPLHRLGLAISLFAVTPPLGIALGPVVGGLLVDRAGFSFHGLFLLDAALSLLAGIMLFAFYREARPANPPHEPTLSLARRAVRLVFTTPVTLRLFAVFALGALANNVAAPFFPLVVERVHPGRAGLATSIGIVFGASALIGALLSPVAGYLGDRFGFRRVLVASSLLVGLSLTAMAFAGSLLVLALAAMLFGASIAASSSMVFALLSTAVPEERRTPTLNLVYVPLYFAGILGGSLGALIARQGLSLVLFTGAVFALSASLVASRVQATASERASA